MRWTSLEKPSRSFQVVAAVGAFEQRPLLDADVDRAWIAGIERDVLDVGDVGGHGKFHFGTLRDVADACEVAPGFAEVAALEDMAGWVPQ